MSKVVNVNNVDSEVNSEYYDVAHIDKLNCHYNIIFGKRSNGKTYSVLKKIVNNYAKHGEQGAYLRRYREDFKGKRGATMFDALIANDEIRKATNGKWDTGEFDSHTQPEDMYYYHKELNLRAMWEVSEHWTPTARPRNEQKPEKLIKQKPDKQKSAKTRNEQRAKDKQNKK